MDVLTFRFHLLRHIPRGSVSRQPIDLEGHRGPLCGSRADDPLGWTHHPGIVVPLDQSSATHPSVAGLRPRAFLPAPERAIHRALGPGPIGLGTAPLVSGIARSSLGWSAGASPGSLGHHFAVRFASREPGDKGLTGSLMAR